MSNALGQVDDSFDDAVDETIRSCLDLDSPTSFFLYAGAGSGKTRSLSKALCHLRKSQSNRLRLRGQRIAVITYTKKARDEIRHRVRLDPLVSVSTIHSFAWSLIQGRDLDIRDWLRPFLEGRINKLNTQLQKGRSGTKTERDRTRKLAQSKQRLKDLPTIKKFIYSPIGDNHERDALNHTEVISITSEFLKEKTTLQSVLVSQYPVLLIDESQDTNHELMEALLNVQKRHSASFCLGLFGDTMQRIYADGLKDLPDRIPDDWERPAKRMNHRCPSRIIELINRIRADADDHQQQGRSDKPQGVVRLFVLPSSVADRTKAELAIANKMAEVTEDPQWRAGGDYKGLILEHRMAAVRMGFEQFFIPLYAIDKFKTGLLDGTLPWLRLFTKRVLPLVRAIKDGNRFAVASVVRGHSPLLETKALEFEGNRQVAQLQRAEQATQTLMNLWENGHDPTLREVLSCIQTTGLFYIPKELKSLAEEYDENELESAESGKGVNEKDDRLNEVTAALEAALARPFREVEGYVSYQEELSPFATHQGVKGLEFPRVMVILDDGSARGFRFSYEKLFGAKTLSTTDRKNEAEGKETSIDQTRRLFYVTCSRAMESLAIVAYTDKPAALVTTVIERRWFQADEVIESPTLPA